MHFIASDPFAFANPFNPSTYYLDSCSILETRVFVFIRDLPKSRDIDNTFHDDISVATTGRARHNVFRNVARSTEIVNERASSAHDHAGDFEIGTIDPFPIARSRERSVDHVTRVRPRDSCWFVCSFRGCESFAKSLDMHNSTVPFNLATLSNRA
jgi:hypothetical protein